MMWIVDSNKYESYEIIGTNIHKEENIFQIWATKTSGKTIKLKESDDEQLIKDYKEAIDYAISKSNIVFTI